MDSLHQDLFGQCVDNSSNSDSDSDTETDIILLSQHFARGSNSRCNKCRHLEIICAKCRRRLRGQGCTPGPSTSTPVTKSSLEQVAAANATSSSRRRNPNASTRRRAVATRNPSRSRSRSGFWDVESWVTAVGTQTQRCSNCRQDWDEEHTQEYYLEEVTTRRHTALHLRSRWHGNGTTHVTCHSGTNTRRRTRSRSSSRPPPWRRPSPFESGLLRALYARGTSHRLGLGLGLLPVVNGEDLEKWACFGYKRAVLRCEGIFVFTEVALTGTSRKLDAMVVLVWLLFWEWPRMGTIAVRDWGRRWLGRGLSVLGITGWNTECAGESEVD